MTASFDPSELIAHAAGVRALARSMLADANTADDVVQEACLAALTRPPSEDTPRRAWFVAVVRNLARRSYRGDARRERRESAVARPETTPSAAHVAGEIEAHRRLVDAVAALDDPYRGAIVLRYFDGLAPRDIAARLGVPAATVSTWIHRGVAMLRERLGKDDDWRAALLPLFAVRRPTPVPLVPIAGVAAMTVKKVAFVAAALLLLAGGAVGVRAWSSRKTPVVETAAAPETPPVRPPRAHVEEKPSAPLPPPVDLDTVDRDLDLHGVVVDRTGAPVAGAKIETYTMPWRRASTLTSDYWRTVAGPGTTSAANGTFAVRLARGASVSLRVSKEGVGETEVAGCQAGERVRVELRPSATLVITTVDAAGAPVAGTTVRLWRLATRLAEADHSGTTDVRGECRIAGLAVGTIVQVDVEPVRLAAPTWLRVDLRAPGETPLRIVLKEGRPLHGRVTDAATGGPIVGARIGISYMMRQAVTSDADGRYAVSEYTGNGYMDLHCLADGHASGWAVVQADDVIDFALQRADRVTGRLVGADGVPVADALLSVIGRDSSSGAEAARTGVSSPNGTFSLADLAHDQPHTLMVFAAGHGRYLLDFDPPPDLGGTRDLGDVALPAARAVAGRVVASDGSPATNVPLELFGFNEDRGRLRGGKFGIEGSYGAREFRRTDDLGRFRFPDLSPGTYTVTAKPDGGRSVTREVEVPPTTDSDVVELRLTGGEPFTVIVQEADGTPVTGRGVELSTADDWSVGRLTDIDGRAVFTPGAAVRFVSSNALPGGPLLLDARAVRVEPGAKEARIVLEAAELVAGIVLGPDGRPVGQAVIEVTCDGKPLSVTPFGGSQAWSGWDGRFEITTPKGKSIDLVLTGFARANPSTMSAGTTLLQGEVRGVAAGTRDVVLRATSVPSDRSLDVVVLGPDGRSEGGALVTAYARGGTQPTPVAAGLSGRAHLENLPASPLFVVARLADDDPRRGEWLDAEQGEVTPSGQEIEIAFVQARRMSGVVLGPDGKPVEGATVSLYRNEKTFSERTSRKGGRFAIPAPTSDTGKLYLFAWRRPDEETYWELRQDDFRVPAEDLTIRLAPPR